MPSASGNKTDRFKAAVMPYLDDAYNLARHLTRNSQDAEDIVQETFLRAFKFFDTFHGTNARAWLLAIVRNCVHAWARSHAAARTRSCELLTAEELDAGAISSELWAANAGNPETQLIASRDAETIRRLVDQLPEPYRETLILREMSDLSYREIAEITSVPAGTVMSRLARARQLFKDAWTSRQGGDGS